MTNFVTPKTISRTLPGADLSSLPATNPGSGKPWLSNGHLVVGNPSAGSSDHGALSGLSDDDHTQYYNDSRLATALSNYATNSALTSGLSGKSDTGHTHDDRYYTELEIAAILSGYALSTHHHDSTYEPIGAAASAVASHVAAGDPHTQYMNASRLATELAAYLPLNGSTAMTGLLTTQQNGNNNTGISLPSSGGAHSIEVTSNIQRIISYNRTYIVRGSSVVFDSNGSTGFTGLGTAIPSLSRGVSITPASSANKACVIRGVSGQVETLFEAQNNSGTALVAIAASGAVTAPSYNGVALTAAGSASQFLNAAGSYASVTADTPAAAYGVGQLAIVPNAGQLISSVTGSLTTQTLLAGREYLVPFTALTDFSIDRMFISSTGSTEYGDLELVIYTSDTAGRPTGSPTRAPSIENTSGTLWSTLASNYSMTRGSRYWIGVRTDQDVGIRTGTASGSIPLGWSTAATPAASYCLSRVVSLGNTAAYPAFTNSLLSTALPPWIGLRIV